MSNDKINILILHCSDSDIDAHDSIKVIDAWHKENGWSGVGYQYFIRGDGIIEKGRPENKIGAHVKGFNKGSIGICFHGSKHFTEAQMVSGGELLDELLMRYNLKVKDILHHNELDPHKTCPNFNFRERIIKYMRVK